jgi:uncharacterized DUF497 family protein
MAAIRRMPWGTDSAVGWDEENEEHVSRHGVSPWEVEEMITQGDFECIRHPKWRKGGKYARRFLLRGRTLGGRPLLVVVERVGSERLRPVAAWEDR